MEKTKNFKNDNNSNQTVDVLYQKMGDRWFAFSLVDGEVMFGSISQDEINNSEASANKARNYRAPLKEC